MSILTTFITDKTTTLGVGTSTVLLVCDTTLNDEGQIDKKGQRVTTSITAATAITAFGNGTLNEQRINEIENGYTQAYVESLSDQELEAALERLNLIEAEVSTKNNSKSI